MLSWSVHGTRESETVWNDSGRPSVEEFKQYSATGGGCSTLLTTLYSHLGQASLYDVTERGNGYCAGPAGVTVRDRRQTIR